MIECKLLTYLSEEKDELHLVDRGGERMRKAAVRKKRRRRKISKKKKKEIGQEAIDREKKKRFPLAWAEKKGEEGARRWQH